MNGVKSDLLTVRCALRSESLYIIHVNGSINLLLSINSYVSTYYM